MTCRTMHQISMIRMKRAIEHSLSHLLKEEAEVEVAEDRALSRRHDGDIPFS